MHKMHGKWINETDFSNYSFEEIEKSGNEETQEIILEEIE